MSVTGVGVLRVLGVLARLVLGGVLLVAGGLKLGDFTGSVQSVVAYELFPYQVSEFVGIVQPVVEVAVGLLLILGLYTRWAALAGVVLMLVFIAGIASAWARGLSIDCGCFSQGGPVAEGQASYLPEILRDVGLAACGALLIWAPYTPVSLDSLFARKGRS